MNSGGARIFISRAGVAVVVAIPIENGSGGEGGLGGGVGGGMNGTGGNGVVGLVGERI
jgi:hypothetical protein